MPQDEQNSLRVKPTSIDNIRESARTVEMRAQQQTIDQTSQDDNQDEIGELVSNINLDQTLTLVQFAAKFQKFKLYIYLTQFEFNLFKPIVLKTPFGMIKKIDQNTYNDKVNSSIITLTTSNIQVLYQRLMECFLEHNGEINQLFQNKKMFFINPNRKAALEDLASTLKINSSMDVVHFLSKVKECQCFFALNEPNSTTPIEWNEGLRKFFKKYVSSGLKEQNVQSILDMYASRANLNSNLFNNQGDINILKNTTSNVAIHYLTSGKASLYSFIIWMIDQKNHNLDNISNSIKDHLLQNSFSKSVQNITEIEEYNEYHHVQSMIDKIHDKLLPITENLIQCPTEILLILKNSSLKSEFHEQGLQFLELALANPRHKISLSCTEDVMSFFRLFAHKSFLEVNVFYLETLKANKLLKEDNIRDKNHLLFQDSFFDNLNYVSQSLSSCFKNFYDSYEKAIKDNRPELILNNKNSWFKLYSTKEWIVGKLLKQINDNSNSSNNEELMFNSVKVLIQFLYDTCTKILDIIILNKKHLINNSYDERIYNLKNALKEINIEENFFTIFQKIQTIYQNFVNSYSLKNYSNSYIDKKYLSLIINSLHESIKSKHNSKFVSSENFDAFESNVSKLICEMCYEKFQNLSKIFPLEPVEGLFLALNNLAYLLCNSFYRHCTSFLISDVQTLNIQVLESNLVNDKFSIMPYIQSTTYAGIPYYAGSYYDSNFASDSLPNSLDGDNLLYFILSLSHRFIPPISLQEDASKNLLNFLTKSNLKLSKFAHVFFLKHLKYSLDKYVQNSSNEELSNAYVTSLESFLNKMLTMKEELLGKKMVDNQQKEQKKILAKKFSLSISTIIAQNTIDDVIHAPGGFFKNTLHFMNFVKDGNYISNQYLKKMKYCDMNSLVPCILDIICDQQKSIWNRDKCAIQSLGSNFKLCMEYIQKFKLKIFTTELQYLYNSFQESIRTHCTKTQEKVVLDKMRIIKSKVNSTQNSRNDEVDLVEIMITNDQISLDLTMFPITDPSCTDRNPKPQLNVVQTCNTMLYLIKGIIYVYNKCNSVSTDKNDESYSRLIGGANAKELVLYYKNNLKQELYTDPMDSIYVSSVYGKQQSLFLKYSNAIKEVSKIYIPSEGLAELAKIKISLDKQQAKFTKCYNNLEKTIQDSLDQTENNVIEQDSKIFKLQKLKKGILTKLQEQPQKSDFQYCQELINIMKHIHNYIIFFSSIINKNYVVNNIKKNDKIKHYFVENQNDSIEEDDVLKIEHFQEFVTFSKKIVLLATYQYYLKTIQSLNLEIDHVKNFYEYKDYRYQGYTYNEDNSPFKKVSSIDYNDTNSQTPVITFPTLLKSFTIAMNTMIIDHQVNPEEPPIRNIYFLESILDSLQAIESSIEDYGVFGEYCGLLPLNIEMQEGCFSNIGNQSNLCTKMVISAESNANSTQGFNIEGVIDTDINNLHAGEGDVLGDNHSVTVDQIT